MTRLTGCSWFCIWFVLLIAVSCRQPPSCRQGRKEVSLPSVSACQRFIRLLEDQQFCSLSQSQNCCVVLAAAVANHCHCWKSLPKATHDLVNLLYQHCGHQHLTDTSQQVDFKVFIGVLTGADHAVQRQAVRETWGTEAQDHRVVFFSATPNNETLFDILRREAAARQDVVVLPHTQESYYNITHQTLEMCRMAAMDPAITHLLKVDDDSYVHVAKLMSRLQALPRDKMFAGYMEKAGSKPHRDESNRWHVPVEEWPWETYPAWAHGAGYIITKDLINEIAAGAAMKIQNHTLFRLEDISMGAWVEFVSKEKGWYVQLVKDRRFNFNGCSGKDLVSHYIQAQQMYCMYRNDGQCCENGQVVQPRAFVHPANP